MARDGIQKARPNNNYPTLPGQYDDHVASVCTSIPSPIGSFTTRMFINLRSKTENAKQAGHGYWCALRPETPRILNLNSTG
jgi:hypothetical protein